MNERETAYNCLCRILIDKQYSNIVLRNNKDNTPFVTQLVYGTLRNYRLARRCWQKYASKLPPQRIGILLDMAVYELCELKTPVYATINEIVNISKHLKGGAYSKMVNAVLRKVDVKDWQDQPLAVATSVPDWLLALWKAHYGKQTAEKIAWSMIEEPETAVRVNRKLTSEEELLKDPAFSSGVVKGCLCYQGNIVESSYFKNNQVIIQSQSSQLVVGSIDLKEGSKVLDMCAAPGSKSLQLAEKLNGSGEVTANDLYPHRVELIKQNALRYQYDNIKPICCDATKISEVLPEDSFDAVLLDAPCSGLGTIKHKPEIKQLITAGDLDDIVSLQKQLLSEAAKMVTDGGLLVYSTCTLNKKENEKQIEAFLQQHLNFTLVKEQTIFPFDFQSDGFYYCQLLRND